MSILTRFAVACIALAALAPGCNPVSTAVKIGVHVVGDVVDDARTGNVEEQIVGKDAAQADAVLGTPMDVYADVKGGREWRVYPVPMDVLQNQRYVVEVAQGRAVHIQMVKMDSSKVDIPLALVYDAKLKGKSPSECETELNMGPPIMAMTSRSTGQLHQMYDARLIKELPKPHYCVVRFDTGGHCEKVKFAEVAGL